MACTGTVFITADTSRFTREKLPHMFPRVKTLDISLPARVLLLLFDCRLIDHTDVPCSFAVTRHMGNVLKMFPEVTELRARNLNLSDKILTVVYTNASCKYL